MRLLLTGGAGYIGSVVARRLRQAGHRTVIVDDLSTGHRAATDGAELVVGDCGDRRLMASLIADRKIEAVVHLAASALVGESLQEPGSYYRNNLERSLVLLETLREGGVSRVVFSSTAAVYGEPAAIPIEEEHPTAPTNPYGETKLAFERALRWYRVAYGTRYVCLRFFNAAGATSDGALGEDHRPETHLIPIVLRAALEETRVPIFGTDFVTRDGTAVRDYIHIEDLADAHVKALERLERVDGGSILNLGNGAGFSVLEVVEAARLVTGRRIVIEPVGRRPGDPETLVASSDRARRELEWSPRFPGLGAILESAWRFLKDHPRGFGS